MGFNVEKEITSEKAIAYFAAMLFKLSLGLDLDDDDISVLKDIMDEYGSDVRNEKISLE